MPELQAGNVLNKRYEIVQKLGKGGFGEVYKARDTQEAERFVAIKRLIETEDDATRKRFEREHRFLSRVTHPNLVHAWEMFEEGKSLYMVLEFVPGNSLGQILKKGERSFTLAEQLAIANKAARGLEVLNTAGILHRDIKPDNIMVDKASGTVKILDLGIGKDLLGASQTFSQGKVLGTLNYISPEQADDNVSETSDVFSLGVTLYQFFLWEKEPPFRDENPYQIMVKILEHKPENVYEREKKKRQSQGQKWDQPEEQAYRQISELVEKAMSKEPEKRCSSKTIADRCEEIQKELMKAELEAKIQRELPQLAEYEKNRENPGSEEIQTRRVENPLLTSMSGRLKPDFSRTLADFHVEEARDWDVKRERDKSIGRARRFKRHIEEYSKKSQASSMKRKAIWGMLSLVLLCIPILWTISRQESPKPGDPKPREKAESPSDKGQKKSDIPEKKKPQKLTFGLPPEIWNECKYQYEGQWMLDMTTDAWCALSVMDQQKYATAYQQGYAAQKKLDVEKTITRSGEDFVMCLIPPGRFWMGSNDAVVQEIKQFWKDQNWGDYDETRHRVVISKAFWMQKTEITQAQWKALTGKSPWSGQQYIEENAKWPATHISWDDVKEKFLPRMGRGFALPTEAQWEYACRAGTTSPYCWGDSEGEMGKYANCLDLTSKESRKYSSVSMTFLETRDGYAGIAPVRSLKSNGYGLHDMAGNASEWCKDRYGNYPFGDVVDPSGSTGGSDRVFRGGSWGNNEVGYFRSADRGRGAPSIADGRNGARVVFLEAV